jgi:hypothetical protein
MTKSVNRENSEVGWLLTKTKSGKQGNIQASGLMIRIQEFDLENNMGITLMKLQSTAN